jgi:drug/metabolite transporter (DMT)-like permease
MMGRLPAGPTTAYSTWFGTALLVPLAFASPVNLGAWSWQAWSASAFLGLGGTTIAFLLYLKGLGAIGASRASIFINLVPVFGVLFSVLLLGERLSGASVLGGVLVIAGVRLLNR